MTDITLYRPPLPPIPPYPQPHDREIYSVYNTDAGPLGVRIADILRKIHKEEWIKVVKSRKQEH